MEKAQPTNQPSLTSDAERSRHPGVRSCIKSEFESNVLLTAHILHIFLPFLLQLVVYARNGPDVQPGLPKSHQQRDMGDTLLLKGHR